MKMTKGRYESEISKAITQWEKDFLGRGSLSVKTDILRDMIIVSLHGVLTQAEYKVCETNEGLLTIKKHVLNWLNLVLKRLMKSCCL